MCDASVPKASKSSQREDPARLADVPGPDEPDLGVFVKGMADALEERGHELERAVLTDPRRGQAPLREPRTRRRPGRPALPAGRRLRPLPRPDGPDRRASRRAHRSSSRLTAATSATSARSPESAPPPALVVRRASAVVAVSDYLREELETHVPEARGKTEVADSGVDLRLFRGADPRTAREELDWNGDGPAFVCVGSLDERKNVMRSRARSSDLADGRLAFVGDGPLRDALEGRPGVRVVGRVPHEQVARWIAAADVVCQPCLIEPFGQALLEAMASERSVRRDPDRRAARVRDRRRQACSSIPRTRTRSSPASAPPPSSRRRTLRPGSRPSRTTSGSRLRGWRRSSSEPLEVGQPELDQRPHARPRSRPRARRRAPPRSSRGPSRPRRPA